MPRYAPPTHTQLRSFLPSRIITWAKAPNLELAGTLRSAARLLCTGLLLVYAATPAKAIERLTGATLTSKVAVSGTVREAERLTGAMLTGKVALAGTSRATERLLGAALGSQSSIASVAGTCREHERLLGAMLGGKTDIEGVSSSQQRLLATGISLAYSSAPIRKGERLLGATLSVPTGVTTALAGTIRATERLPGSMSLLPITTWSLQSPNGTAWVPTISIAGIVTWTSGGPVLTPIAPCFQGTPDTTVWTPQISNAGVVTIIDGPATGNYRAALLDSNLVTWLILVDSDGIVHLSPVGRLVVAGTIRTVERLTGVLSSKVLLAGTCREIERATGATLGRTAALSGRLRTTERLPGSILGGKTALTGKLRATERLTGALQFTGSTQALAGRSRTSQRLLATGISLAYSATPARAGVRIRGATSGILNLVAFTGVSRSGARLIGSLGLVYDTAAIVQTERMRGATLGWKVYLTGTGRSTERLSGRLQTAGTTASVQGTICQSERLRGATLRAKVALRGTLRESARLAGSVLEGKVSLRGTARGTEQLTGRLQFAGTTADLAGTVQQTALLQGILLLRGETTADLAGTICESELLAGAILEGKVALKGTALQDIRTLGQLSQTVQISGTAIGSELVRGATLREAQPITALTGVLRVSEQVSGAVLIQRLPLRGTVREVERVRGARFHLPTYGYWYQGGYAIRGIITRL